MQRDRSLGDALRAFWVSRLVVLCSGTAAAGLLGVRWENAQRYDAGGLTRGFGSFGDVLAAPFARWDAVWFLRIAQDGYDDTRAAFFPLFPLLANGVGLLFGSALVGGIVVSLTALLVALVLLHRLVALDFGRDVAALTVVLVAAFPGAVWFSAVYSESLFLALSVGAVYAARTDRWALAGIAGALAAATRSAGVVLLVPLVVLWWQHSDRRRADLAWIGAVPLGLAAFCGVLALSGQDASAPFSAQEVWYRAFAGPFMAIPDGVAAGVRAIGDLVTGEPRPTTPFDPAALDAMLLVTLVLVLVALAGAVRRLPPAYWLYALAALALPLSFPVEDQPLMSLPRFAAVLWPLHLWFATWLVRRRPLVRRGAVVASLVLLGVTSALVSTWEWVA
jgi:hypothetical protein